MLTSTPWARARARARTRVEARLVSMNALTVEAKGITFTIAQRAGAQITRWSAEAATELALPRSNAQRRTRSSRVEARTRARKARTATAKDGKGEAEFGQREAMAIQVSHQHAFSMRARH